MGFAMAHSFLLPVNALAETTIIEDFEINGSSTATIRVFDFALSDKQERGG
jgi:hypothetical protein